MEKYVLVLVSNQLNLIANAIPFVNKGKQSAKFKLSTGYYHLLVRWFHVIRVIIYIYKKTFVTFNLNNYESIYI